MKGLEIPGHSLSFAKSWEITCSCGDSFGVDQDLSVAHLRLWSLPLTTRAFCALWKMKRSTARKWLLDHGCRMAIRDLKPGDDRRADKWWITAPPETVSELTGEETLAALLMLSS